MSTTKKVFLRVLPIVLVLMVVFTTNVFAFNSFNTETINQSVSGGTGISSADKAIKNVWATVSLILQVLAVAAIVFAGVRYMFASADGKADIKKQTIGLVVGAILVFGASFIINFIVTITQEVTA